MANPSEATMKAAILGKLHALLVALSEIPLPLRPYRHFRHLVCSAFLSHLFLNVERECLLPSELRGVLGMNAINLFHFSPKLLLAFSPAPYHGPYAPTF